MPLSTALLTRLIIHLKKAARAVAAIRWPHPCGPYPRCTGRRIPPGGDGRTYDVVFVRKKATKFLRSAARRHSRKRVAEGNAIPYPLEQWNGKGCRENPGGQSKPDFIGQPKAPEGAPNVLVIMLDDAGYSSATSFGGVMKNADVRPLGDEGLRYTHFPWPRSVPRPAARC
jgi:hypothetical protein